MKYRRKCIILIFFFILSTIDKAYILFHTFQLTFINFISTFLWVNKLDKTNNEEHVTIIIIRILEFSENANGFRSSLIENSGIQMRPDENDKEGITTNVQHKDAYKFKYENR